MFKQTTVGEKMGALPQTGLFPSSLPGDETSALCVVTQAKAVALVAQWEKSKQVQHIQRFAPSFLTQFPAALEIWQHLANVYIAQQQWFEAQQVYQQALLVFSHDARIKSSLEFNLGVCLARQSKWSEAEAYLQRSVTPPLDNSSQSIRRLQELAACYFQQKKPALAIPILLQGLRALQAMASGTTSFPQDLPDLQAQLLDNLGCALQETGQMYAAENALKTAVLLQPHRAGSWLNLGTLYLKQRQRQPALAALQKATQLDPTAPLARHALSLALKQQGQWEAALIEAQAACGLDPHLAEARMHLGEMHLSLGHYGPGWTAYEARLARPQHHGAGWLAAHLPPWQGQALLAGQTLLLHAEQGFGDTLQFARFALMLPSIYPACEIILAVPPPLLRLFEESPAFACLRLCCLKTAPPPCADYQLPLMSLPRVLGLEDETTFAQTVPYLQASRPRVAAWDALLGPKHAGARRVGLAWTGRTTHAHNTWRSLPGEAVASLLQSAPPAIEWVALCPEDAAFASLPPHLPLRRLPLNDYADTAALMTHLDAVVSIDTSVAHLAGAMAQPLWLLLSFDPDWRWQVAGQHSPWYPSARLFRQPLPGNWGAMVAAVQAGLSTF
jgi:tetratricopeptide (TPR) repeat protein